MRSIIVLILILSFSVLSTELCSTPAVSIFKSSRMWPMVANDLPLTKSELIGYEKIEVVGDNPVPYYLIPGILYKIRTFYGNDNLSADDIEIIKGVNSIFDKLFDSYSGIDLIDNQVNAQKALCHYSDWFKSLTQDNSFLPKMIFTMDDGPFYGEVLNTTDISKANIVYKELPNSKLRIGLYKNKDKKIVVGVWDENQSILWQRYLTVDSGRKISFAQFIDSKPIELPSYGYKVELITEGDFGKEYTPIYLTETGEFRFYFISW